MPRIHIEVSTSLKRLRGCENGKLSMEIPDETRVKDLLILLGAVPGEVELIIVNGDKVDGETLVQDGDSIELYPVFGGG